MVKAIQEFESLQLRHFFNKQSLLRINFHFIHLVTALTLFEQAKLEEARASAVAGCQLQHGGACYVAGRTFGEAPYPQKVQYYKQACELNDYDGCGSLGMEQSIAEDIDGAIVSFSKAVLTGPSWKLFKTWHDVHRQEKVQGSFSDSKKGLSVGRQAWL